jgi:hypothetical protein
LEGDLDAGNGNEANAVGSECSIGLGQDGDPDPGRDESEDRDAAGFLDDLGAEPGCVARCEELVVGERGAVPGKEDEGFADQLRERDLAVTGEAMGCGEQNPSPPPRRTPSSACPPTRKRSWFLGALAQLRVSGEQTGAAFSITENLARHGGGSPVHRHDLPRRHGVDLHRRGTRVSGGARSRTARHDRF